MTHYPIWFCLWYRLKKCVSTWPSSCAEKQKEITWQTKGKCSYKEPYFCKWTIKKARVSLFAWGSSLTAWYVALALSSSSVLSEEKKKETRAQPLSRHFLANKKQAIVNRFYEFYRAFCRLHVFALNSDWFSFAAHGEIKAKQKSEFAFLLIGHFRVPKPSLSKWGPVYNLSLKMSSIWMRMKIISISKAEHLTSFWYRGSGELENGLINQDYSSSLSQMQLNFPRVENGI